MFREQERPEFLQHLLDLTVIGRVVQPVIRAAQTYILAFCGSAILKVKPKQQIQREKVANAILRRTVAPPAEKPTVEEGVDGEPELLALRAVEKRLPAPHMLSCRGHCPGPGPVLPSGVGRSVLRDWIGARGDIHMQVFEGGEHFLCRGLGDALDQVEQASWCLSFAFGQDPIQSMQLGAVHMMPALEDLSNVVWETPA